MIKKIEKFIEYFKDFNDSYRVIGGSACTLIFDEVEIDYRATKDIDVVICSELISQAFIDKLWIFLQDGGYKVRIKSNGKPNLYRFSEPEDKDFLYMIEVLAGVHTLEKSIKAGTIVPVTIDENLVSLSAMLMDDELYKFILSNSIEIKGIPICDEYGIIPLKATAWRNLTEEKNRGEHVNSRDISKHKNDILRLSQLLVSKKLNVNQSIKKDIKYFLDNVVVDRNTLDNLGIKQMNLDEIFQVLMDVYEIDS